MQIQDLSQKSELQIRGVIEDYSNTIFLISRGNHICDPSLERSRRDGLMMGHNLSFFFKNMENSPLIIPAIPPYLGRAV